MMMMIMIMIIIRCKYKRGTVWRGISRRGRGKLLGGEED
jgi:hypothetical protein